MKFAHEFKAALEREGFPARWVETAVPYSQLKKCIKKVESELLSFGLDNATLRRLLPSNEDAIDQHPRKKSCDGPVAFQYNFDGMNLSLYFERGLPLIQFQAFKPNFSPNSLFSFK